MGVLRGIVTTHSFAKGLLAQRNEKVRMWVLGRFSVTWDTGQPVPEPVSLSDIFKPATPSTPTPEEPK